MDFHTQVTIRRWIWVIIELLSSIFGIGLVIASITERSIIFAIIGIIMVIIFFISRKKVKWYEEREDYATKYAIQEMKRRGHLK